MYTVYVLQSQSTGKIYIGYTADLLKRIKRHNKEIPVSTKGYTYKNRGPWMVVYKEEYSTRLEAGKREKQLKSSRGRSFIKELINKVP